MISINCPYCEKIIEVHTLSSEGPHSLHEQERIPYHIKISLDGTLMFCGCCKKASRFEYDYVDDVLSVVKV